jgi:purine-binding chemotaxis protein CheW
MNMKTNDIDKKKSYINFSIGKENFAIVVDRVLEILHLEQLTHVPNASDFVKGILNFRGAIVPVINLNKRFNFGDPQSEGTMVIVVEVLHEENQVLMGLLVDEVTDVIEFGYKDIRAVPEIGIKYNPDFLEGFIEMEGRFTMVLDVDRVLSVAELAEINEVTIVQST